MPHKDKKPRRRLKDLRVDKIALVDTPAVQGSMFVIAKREEVEKEEPNETPEVTLEVSTAEGITTNITPDLEQISKDISDLKTAVVRLTDFVATLQKDDPPEPEPEPVPARNPRLAKLAESVQRMASGANGLVKDLSLATGKLSDTGEE
jgi:hypothetical protein